MRSAYPSNPNGVSDMTQFRQRIASIVFRGVLGLSILGSVCDPLGVDDASGGATYDPSWISASWVGGQRGGPNDRTDRSPTTFQGRECPTSSITLDNDVIFPGSSSFELIIGNRCVISVFTFTCITKGIPIPQGSLLASCATDPLNTPKWSLGTSTIQTFRTIGYTTAATFAINIFFCTDETTLAYEPIRCI